MTCPLDTGCKSNIHKTLSRRPVRLVNERLMYVQFTSCVQGVPVSLNINT